MILSPPAQRFLKDHPEYEKMVEAFNYEEKATFQKYCEDLELEEVDDLIRNHKHEIRKKLNYMLSKQGEQNRIQKKEDEALIRKYFGLNKKDIQTIKDLKKLTGKDYFGDD